MKPILTPYLAFDGQTAEAMKFYQSVLGGELKMQTFGESGIPTSDENKEYGQLTDKFGIHWMIKITSSE